MRLPFSLACNVAKYRFSTYLRVLTSTCGGSHPGRVEPASPRHRKHTEVPNPDVAAFIGFAAQSKLSRFVNAGASSLRTLPFGFTPGDATKTQGIGV